MVFVLDSSGSVTAKNFEKVKGFVKDFLKDADIDNDAVRVGVNVYSSLSTVSFNLNTYSTKTDVFNAIDAVPFKGQGTRTGLALEKMKYEMFTAANGDRDGVGNVAIVIADGESSDSPIPKADAAREAGIYMYAIGVGLANTEELEGIANKPSDEHVFSIEDFDALKDLGSKVLTAVCGKSLRMNPLFYYWNLPPMLVIAEFHCIICSQVQKSNNYIFSLPVH